MGMMENSATIMAPLLLRNTVKSVLIYADKSLLNFAGKYKLLEIIRYLIVTSFLFFLRLFLSFFPSNYLHSLKSDDGYTFKPTQSSYITDSGIGDSGIGRSLWQLLVSVNDIPVSSTKYRIVRSLAERLIEGNNREDVEALREVNRRVLSAAFSRTICRVEAALIEMGTGTGQSRLDRVFRTVWDGVWSGRVREDVSSRLGNSAEKLAAELLWLTQKLVGCGFEEEAVERWVSASNLAQLSVVAENRVQGSLVKVSGLEETEGGNKERLRQTKMKMLITWLPLLCRGNNGTDIPVLSLSERAELEKILEDAIDMLQHEEQEQVLSLWLHHFTYCPSSDWPNLHASYARWCTTSRKLFFSSIKDVK
ncbi:1,8-cineole synthase [Gossypium australe]|uniref:1,8-cineole synthase n=1 Tax=Gossypium australe TaxID=47621 RepID=A0A5B6V355_9ROSI|nr:1,8-cineole synthase [Gossypium australe]